ncbi:hypothetical protein V6N11_027019 [Hibiscus sabdariffa]|uniref:Translocon-associated protein subunit alpha n=1 Tax=Hibiscus sabdariffa TaxID=183260 RepID=A0ABR2PFR2_9ROSI
MKLSKMAMRSFGVFFFVLLLAASPLLQVARCQSGAEVDVADAVDRGDLGIVVVVAGEETELLVGMENVGGAPLNIIAIQASVHLPYDHRMLVQNLTAQVSIDLQQCVCIPFSASYFPYMFAVSKYLQPGTFDLVGTIVYEIDQYPYQNTFYNGTIEVVEAGGFVSVESVFLVTLGIALLVLLGLWLHGQFQHITKKTKKAPKVEVGTRTTDASMDEWLQDFAEDILFWLVLIFRELLHPISFQIKEKEVDHADGKTVEVVGVGECADCAENNLETSQAFSGLRVNIDCKPENGKFFKTRGSGELDKQGNFKVSLPEEMVKDGGLKEECYAQLHSVSAAPCPAHDGLESVRIVFKSTGDKKHSFGLKGKLRFSPVTCASAFFWPHFKFPPLPKWNHPPLPKWNHPLPKLPLPPLKGFHHHHPIFPPIYKKPLPPPVPVTEPPPVPVYKPPPVPVYEKPHPPPVPVYKPPPVPVYEKPHPPPVPVYKPPPVPVYEKPLPPPVPVYKPPPVPVYKKPHPPPVPVYKKPLPPPVPIYKPPPVPVYKKPLPPPVPIYKPPPVPVYKKPLPPPVPVYKPPVYKPPPVPVYEKPHPPPVPVYKPPPVPVYEKPHPPPVPVYKPPPVPVYVKPHPPPVPVYKPPPVPVYEKPHPPPVPVYKPPPVPVYKPPPVPVYEKPHLPPVPVYKPPPVPVYEKPHPPPVPVYEPPPTPVYTKPLPPPVPIYKPKPVPPIAYKPLPPLPKIPPFPKKPCPPLPTLPPLPPKSFPHHPKFGKWPPLPPFSPQHP